MMQMELREANFPVIVVFAGVDAPVKAKRSTGCTSGWIRAGWLPVPSVNFPTRNAPAGILAVLAGAAAQGATRVLFLSSWYSVPILDHVYGHVGLAELNERLARIKSSRKPLADDGALILKFWMHLAKDKQKERLRKLEKNPLLHWRISSATGDTGSCTINSSPPPSTRS